MRCQCCRKKVGIMAIDCKCCAKKFCSRCITLETHKCEGIEDDIRSKKDDLENKLKSAVTDKKSLMGLE